MDLSLLKAFPHKVIYRQALFPIARQNGSLKVATSDPFDLYSLDEVSAATGLTIEPVLASRQEIDTLLWDKLSDALDEPKKKAKVGNILTKLRRAGQIRNAGSRGAPEWRLVQDDAERLAERNGGSAERD